MPNVLITGGTGFVGKKLTDELVGKGYDVTVLTRKLPIDKPDNKNISFAAWDPAKNIVDEDALYRADAVVHLAGAGVMDKSWSAAFRKEILQSRTESLRLLFSKLESTPHRVKVLVSASATGWYDAENNPYRVFHEEDPPAEDFLGEVCRQWEAAADEAGKLGIRVCKLRTGIVLGREGGAYPSFRNPLKAGMATIMGSGKQMVPWIHIDDLCNLYISALEGEQFSGAFNAVAPQAVSNERLIRTIAKGKNGNKFIPVHVPEFVLKLMLGERSIEILKSVNASAQKAEAAGFRFVYPHIEEAVADLES